MDHEARVREGGQNTRETARDNHEPSFGQKQIADARRYKAGRQQQPNAGSPLLDSEPEQQADQNHRRQNQKQTEADEQSTEIGRSRRRLETKVLHRLKRQSHARRFEFLKQSLAEQIL